MIIDVVYSEFQKFIKDIKEKKNQKKSENGSQSIKKFEKQRDALLKSVTKSLQSKKSASYALTCGL